MIRYGLALEMCIDCMFALLMFHWSKYDKLQASQVVE